MTGQAVYSKSDALDNKNPLSGIAGDVSATVEQTENLSEIHGHGEEVFYQSAEFWVGFAFILVVVFLFKPLGKTLKSMLIKKRGEIINQLNEAEQLRDDAQKLLAQYEKKFLHAKDEADEILLSSQKEIELLKNEELQKLEQDLEIRRKEVENNIALSAENVRSEINKTVAAAAVEKAKTYIRTHLSSAEQTQLIDDSLNRIIKKLSSAK